METSHKAVKCLFGFTALWEVSIVHLRRIWNANRGRLLLCIPGPFLFGTYMHVFLLFETNPFPEVVVIFPDYVLRTSHGTFALLLMQNISIFYYTLFGYERLFSVQYSTTLFRISTYITIVGHTLMILLLIQTNSTTYLQKRKSVWNKLCKDTYTQTDIYWYAT